MSATLKTLKATVDTDGTVRLLEKIELAVPVKAVVTLLVDDELDEEGVSAEDFDAAASKVFDQHDELFRKLAQ